MTSFRLAPAFLALLSVFLARPIHAQQPSPTTVTQSTDSTPCPAGMTCVANDDMKVFVQLLKDQKCRTDTPPKFTLDPITVVVDRQGRVYYSGNEPKPYKLHIDWCNYRVDATAKVSLTVAQKVEPTWGFRFRPKAAFGYLPVEALEEKDASKGLDGGILVEPFFIQWFNVNAYVGVRSVGAGIGFDLTKNFGLYLGYSIAWGTWRSNPFGGLYFALW